MGRGVVCCTVRSNGSVHGNSTSVNGFMIEEAQASVYKVVNNVRYYSYTCIGTKFDIKRKIKQAIIMD